MRPQAGRLPRAGRSRGSIRVRAADTLRGSPMNIQVHDTLTRQKRPLEPVEPGQVRLYACGPTVYSDCHIGHLMGPVLFDAVARWLQARGFAVRFVNNITDIDDKIIRRAAETGETWQAVAERYTAQYFEFLQQLGVTTITDHPRCTEYVEQMVAFIAKLVEADRAYVAGDGVYYDCAKQDGYGKLSGRRLEDMLEGARIGAVEGLRQPADFALWKFAKPGEPSWPSPWGDGRPGWHVECSVMARELLGEKFDLHGGGDDLKFPHHENEIAQSEAYGDAFACQWMHHGLAQYGGKKIAKSDPRMKDPEFSKQFNARYLVDTYGAPAVRLFLLRGHYRRPIDFEPTNVAAAKTGLVRLLERLGPLAEEASSPPLTEILGRALPDDLATARDRFAAAMDDDFNTGEAIAQLFVLQNAAAKAGADAVRSDLAWTLLRDLGRLLGLFRPGDLEQLKGGAVDERAGAVVGLVLRLRAEARAAKDFATADRLRDALQTAGVEVHDAGEATDFELPGGERAAETVLDAVLPALVELRREARAAKDFARSDALRDGLAEAGVLLKDAPDGSVSWQFA